MHEPFSKWAEYAFKISSQPVNGVTDGRESFLPRKPSLSSTIERAAFCRGAVITPWKRHGKASPAERERRGVKLMYETRWSMEVFEINCARVYTCRGGVSWKMRAFHAEIGTPGSYERFAKKNASLDSKSEMNREKKSMNLNKPRENLTVFTTRWWKRGFRGVVYAPNSIQRFRKCFTVFWNTIHRRK